MSGGAVIGLSADEVTRVVSSTGIPAYRLGTIGGYDDPSLGHRKFVYGRANGAVTGQGYICLEQTGFDFVMATTTTSAPGASGPGTRVGAAQAVLADNEYGWFQIYGKGYLRTAGAVAIGTKMNTTATGGALDDDATAGSETIDGAVLMTAAGGAATSSDAMFTYPAVGRTL